MAASNATTATPKPADFDSCLDWWAVDLFVTADGRIRAVTLDRDEP